MAIRAVRAWWDGWRYGTGPRLWLRELDAMRREGLLADLGRREWRMGSRTSALAWTVGDCGMWFLASEVGPRRRRGLRRALDVGLGDLEARTDWRDDFWRHGLPTTSPLFGGEVLWGWHLASIAMDRGPLPEHLAFGQELARLDVTWRGRATAWWLGSGGFESGSHFYVATAELRRLRWALLARSWIEVDARPDPRLDAYIHAGLAGDLILVGKEWDLLMEALAATDRTTQSALARRVAEFRTQYALRNRHRTNQMMCKPYPFLGYGVPGSGMAASFEWAAIEVLLETGEFDPFEAMRRSEELE